MKTAGIAILVIFYAVYIGKMFLQKRKGIQTDQMARGKQKDKLFYIEFVLKIATYAVVVVEVISIFIMKDQGWLLLRICGMLAGFAGDLVFAAAVLTMKDSWRAGISKKDKTDMITDGIYKISRNPAFLGFDCVYLGLVLMFYNLPLLLFSVFAMVMLHLQILQEEKHLAEVFGNDYLNYKNKVCRYLGRKR